MLGAKPERKGNCLELKLLSASLIPADANLRPSQQKTMGHSRQADVCNLIVQGGQAWNKRKFQGFFKEEIKFDEIMREKEPA